jgi:DNA polymerase III, delta subunit
MINILKEIEQGNPKNFYLFYGEEDYLKNHYVNELKKKFIPEEFSDMNFNIFEENADAIINCVMSLPFMNEYRLVIIKESGFFYSGKKNETELILKYIDDFPKSSIIIFCESKIDKRNKLYKKICDVGLASEIKKPIDKELVKWIIKICKVNKKIISPENALLILKITMGNMEFLKNELGKLINYCSEEINSEQINLLCTKSVDAKIFDLVANMGNKNLKLALESYNNLIFLKEQPLMILAMISRQFVLILQSKIFSNSGLDSSSIAQKLGTRSFVISDCLRQSKNFSSDKLICAIKDCLDVDYKVKTGQLSDKLAVETLIMKYSA